MRSIRIIRILILRLLLNVLEGNTRAKYLADRVRVWPTDSSLLSHVNHPIAHETLPTLKQKSTGCRPPRKKKRTQNFR